MNKAEYEKINLNENIPAFIWCVDKENYSIDDYLYISPHWHRSMELTLVIEGEINGRINGTPISVKKNEFVFVNSGDVHEFEKNKTQISSGVIMIISYDFIKKVYPNFDNVRLDIKKVGLKKDRLIEIFLDIKEYSLNPKELDYLKINSYLYEILYILFSNCISEEVTIQDERFKYRERQKEILTYINENYKEDLSLDYMAKKFYMSKEYFSRKFHQWFGVTYKVYLSNYRLNKAYENIIKTDENIKDISAIHGFSNVKSFINIFKEKYGMTPNKYRKALKELKNDSKKDKKEQQ
ncbi:helix-turn-helix domain-containing protein [Clostridium thermobutyricum]|uniref:Bifunctional transcriptional activator/DNA repair enzyme AdaA n=1 Tax=Clostridium thermobutyricum DSM 4928 TaxID=1121339 RepID=A0A1V4STQ8_9CLOT|nr:helix-turn-helix domain-containing protein [Clostridium thermobutyricum]OPX46617.1 bifunctional transcriptional activator/DNA repair enzyme AdaA [Clostridium thermobutyricum DSM 4928]